MKTILFIALCVLLVKTSFSVEFDDVEESQLPEKSQPPPLDEDTIDNGDLLQDVDKSDKDTDDKGQDADKSDEELAAEGQSVIWQGIKITKGSSLIIQIPSYGSSGVTYTRWGRTSCPSGAQLLYAGYMSGGHYNQWGNGADFLCLPTNPQYLSTAATGSMGYLYPTEYESGNKIFPGITQDYNAPCAVCYVASRSTKLMVPARISCPSSWRREYYGYLMTSYHGHRATQRYECIDNIPDRIGTRTNSNGALLYFVRTACTNNGDGLPCSVYSNTRATTCTVCTK